MTDSYGQVTPYLKGEDIVWDKEDLTHPFYGKVSLANYTAFTIGMMRLQQGKQAGKLFIGIELKGSYTFGGWAHWEYIAEKLMLGEADARNMADFINTQNDVINQAPMQGKYDKDILDE
jgi:hypothetical protein